MRKDVVKIQSLKSRFALACQSVLANNCLSHVESTAEY